MEWCNRYVGIPFRDGGRDESGCDCWGLVRLIYARELGIYLPTYGETSAFNLQQVVMLMQQGAQAEAVWIEPQEPGEFDVVVMRRTSGGRAPSHVGVLTQTGALLHVESRTDAVMVPLSHFTVAGRVLFIRRHRIRDDALKARSGEARSERSGGLADTIQPGSASR